MAATLRAAGAPPRSCLAGLLEAGLTFPAAACALESTYRNRIDVLTGLADFLREQPDVPIESLLAGVEGLGLHPLSLICASTSFEMAKSWLGRMECWFEGTLPVLHQRAHWDTGDWLETFEIHGANLGMHTHLELVSPGELILQNARFAEELLPIRCPSLEIRGGSGLRRIDNISWEEGTQESIARYTYPYFCLSLGDLPELETLNAPPLGSLSVVACPSLERIDDGLEARMLDFRDLPKLEELGQGLRGAARMHLENCPRLQLPETRFCTEVHLARMPSLDRLPHLRGNGSGHEEPPSLRIHDCPNLRFPDPFLFIGALELSGYPLENLPNSIHLQSHFHLSAAPGASLPEDLLVEGWLHLIHLPDLVTLPPSATCGTLVVRDCPKLSIPKEWVTSRDLRLEGMEIGILPAGLRLNGELFLKSCSGTDLPPGLSVQSLRLSNCQGLTALPADGYIDFLSVEACPLLKLSPREEVLLDARLGLPF